MAGWKIFVQGCGKTFSTTLNNNFYVSSSRNLNQNTCEVKKSNYETLQTYTVATDVNMEIDKDKIELMVTAKKPTRS